MNGPAAKSIAGLAWSKLMLGGNCRWRRAKMVLMSPAMPAAASKWPTLPLTEPIEQVPGSTPANTRRRAAISMGSPSGVPVPWASMYWIVSGGTSAIATASAIARAWPSSLGAVKPTLSAPSLLTALPRITARIGSPVSQCVVEAPQHHHPHAAPEHRALGRGVERTTPSLG